MASLEELINAEIMKYSISCFDVPDELLNKNVAKHYFQQFGKVLRIRLRPKQKSCIVEYNDEESAVRALTESGDFNGFTFRVNNTKLKLNDKKKHKKKLQPEWPIDADIQLELEAMRGTSSFSPAFVQSKDVKQTKKGRVWKSDKVKTKSDGVASPSQNTEQDEELLKVIMNSATSSEEKFRILDARDKLIRSRTVRQSELSRVRKTVGTCPDMCPEKERLMREVQHQVATYEQLTAHKGSMNHNLAVKQYSRSSADQESPLPHELRPVKVLLLTMGYLLHKIMDLCETSDVNLAEWYHFLWDRTRGIRKDVTQQELCCADSVQLVEQCARFHIFCAERLVGEDVSVFDEKINTENLTKCLQTLKYMYHDLRVKHGVVCKHEAEFRAYIVLLNLNDGNFMWEVQHLDKTIQQSSEVKFAIQVYSALDKNNYVRFFKLVKSTTYLNACILLRYFNQVRYRALLTILKSYSPRQPYTQYPVMELSKMLAFEDLETAVEFLNYYGLGLNPDKSHVILNRKMFGQPDMPFGLERAINVIESKRECSVGEVVCGALLPPKDYETHLPHNSFDDSGYLKLSELPKEFHEKYQEYLGENLQFESNEKNDYEDDTMSEKDEFAEKNDIREEKINENSSDETDRAVANFPAFKQNNSDDNRSQSPLTIHLETSNTAQNNFWTKPVDNQFRFNTNSNNLLNRDKTEQDVPLSSKPVCAASSFTFLSDSSQSSFVSKPIIPIPMQKEPGPPVFQPFICKTIEPVKKIVEPCRDELLEKERKEQIKRKQEADEREIRLKAENIRLKQLQNLEKKRRDEEAKKNAETKNEVNLVLCDMLNQIEERLVKEKLNEISENIVNRRALKFIKHWKNITRISRKKRKNFFDNPVWISSKSASSEAEGLFTPSQTITLSDIKRYKRGTPELVKISELHSIAPIDIFNLTYRILYEKSFSNGNVINLNLFWKVGVSFRDPNEKNTYINRYLTLLKSAFDWQQINNEQLIVKRYYNNNGGSLTYCIKEITNVNNHHNSNGFIFINFGNISQISCNRLNKILVNSFAIPIIVIINNSNLNNEDLVIQQLKLDDLVQEQIISDYKVLFCTDKTLDAALSTSLLFLAENINPKPNLEMDALPVYLRNCIGEEFWFRIETSAEMNAKFNILLQQPNVAIELHNQSLQKCLDVIFNTDFMNEPNFPKEFQPFVKQQQIFLPCTYEYFPVYWNSKNYLHKLQKLLGNLFLPRFNLVWPPKDQTNLQDILEEYCGHIFKDPTCIVLRLLSELLKNIDFNSEFERQMAAASWANVIRIIISERLKTTQFFDKTHAVFTVVYKVDDLKAIRNTPWWYNLETIRNKIETVEIEEESEPEVIIEESEEEIDIDKMLDDMNEDDSYIERMKLNGEIRGINSLLTDLDQSMEIQKKIMNKFQETITRNFSSK